MNGIGLALLGLLVGLAVGVALALARRRSRLAEARLQGALELQSAELRRLADAARARGAADEHVRAEVLAARRTLEALRVREEERRARDTEAWEVVRRLSVVLAGAPSKGRGGENVLREQLAELPPGMLVSDLRVNGKVVEYGLLLPDGRRMPIDSKWSAVREIEALERATDQNERERCAREVERIVGGRVREVAGYLDPALTGPVAVAAVPDAAYAVLRRAHAEAFARGVIVVPYSMALPILLFLYTVASRYGSTVDAQGCLSELAGVLDALEGVVENRVARAAAMVANGADELRTQIGKARGSIARARSSGMETAALDPREEELRPPLRVAD